VSLYKIDQLSLPSRPQTKIPAQQLINVGAITEIDGFSDRWNVPPGPDVSYSSAALSY
jgi:hypothetical protein